VARVPAGDHEVHRLPAGRREKLRDDLRRVLQIPVHHQRPGSAGRPHSADDGGTQTTSPLTLRPPQEPYRQVEIASDRGDLLCSLVIRVVHEEDLGRRAGKGIGKPVEQRHDVVDLVPGRDNDREFGRHEVQLLVDRDGLRFPMRVLRPSTPKIRAETVDGR
jgi:hypothetical protein